MKTVSSTVSCSLYIKSKILISYHPHLGRFQDPSGIIDGVVHRDLFTSKLDNITSGAVLLLKDVSLFRTSFTEHKCYLNITTDNFVTALGLQGEHFHPFS